MAAIATLTGASARFPGGLREVAPRMWAWLQPNGGLGESNAGLSDHWWGDAVLPAEVSPPARARLLVQTVALGRKLAAS